MGEVVIEPIKHPKECPAVKRKTNNINNITHTMTQYIILNTKTQGGTK